MTEGPAGAGVRYVVAGAGGMGREALAWARDAWPAAEAVGFWVAPGGPAPTGAGTDLPVLEDLAEVRDLGATRVALGIGDNARRRAAAAEVASAGLESLTVVHPTAFLGPGVKVESGAVVAPGVVVTRDVVIGAGAILNYRAAVGHDGRIGAWAFVGPGAVLAGDVTIGEEGLVGAGAVVLPGRLVARRATVGAGAIVASDVPASATVVGNPARPTG